MDKKLDIGIILEYIKTNSLFSKNQIFLYHSNIIIIVQPNTNFSTMFEPS